ncbi:MAG: ANTAR domain-containing protein [Actinobacteria bacterium]|nr:ANTAR domain-containing protein [Actinomycetota bacterium]
MFWDCIAGIGPLPRNLPRSGSRESAGIGRGASFDDEEAAFKLLRDQARRSQLKMVEIAEAVLSSYKLLPSESRERVPAK